MKRQQSDQQGSPGLGQDQQGMEGFEDPQDLQDLGPPLEQEDQQGGQSIQRGNPGQGQKQQTQQNQKPRQEGSQEDQAVGPFD